MEINEELEKLISETISPIVIMEYGKRNKISEEMYFLLAKKIEEQGLWKEFKKFTSAYEYELELLSYCKKRNFEDAQFNRLYIELFPSSICNFILNHNDNSIFKSKTLDNVLKILNLILDDMNEKEQNSYFQKLKNNPDGIFPHKIFTRFGEMGVCYLIEKYQSTNDLIAKEDIRNVLMSHKNPKVLLLAIETNDIWLLSNYPEDEKAINKILELIDENCWFIVSEIKNQAIMDKIFSLRFAITKNRDGVPDGYLTLSNEFLTLADLFGENVIDAFINAVDDKNPGVRAAVYHAFGYLKRIDQLGIGEENECDPFARLNIGIGYLLSGKYQNFSKVKRLIEIDKDFEDLLFFLQKIPNKSLVDCLQFHNHFDFVCTEISYRLNSNENLLEIENGIVKLPSNEFDFQEKMKISRIYIEINKRKNIEKKSMSFIEQGYRPISHKPKMTY